MANVLHVSKRDDLGTRVTHRLRKGGRVPAVLYGHGQENVNLSVATSDIESAVRHHAKLVELQGAVAESALIKEVQWDAFGSRILHVDFNRVSAEESVDVVVVVELVGEAPGAKQGGIVEQPTHELEIRCPAGAIPDRFAVRINTLGLAQSILARDVELPAGAELLSDPEMVIATCQEPIAAVEEVVAPAEGEPEVIGRKEEEEEEESEK